jgi:hypothetical protein
MIFQEKKRPHQIILILGLVSSLLVVGSVLTSQSAAHSLHHDHHKATTHASVICSWMCAAGQVVENAHPILESPLYSIRPVEIFPTFSILPVSPPFIFQRGPPLVFL